MKQALTAKLKRKPFAEQKNLLRDVSLAYRDGLNYASQVAWLIRDRLCATLALYALDATASPKATPTFVLRWSGSYSKGERYPGLRPASSKGAASLTLRGSLLEYAIASRACYLTPLIPRRLRQRVLIRSTGSHKEYASASSLPLHYRYANGERLLLLSRFEGAIANTKDKGKIANGTKLQKLVYFSICSSYGLPAQMACNRAHLKVSGWGDGETGREECRTEILHQLPTG